MPSNKDALIRYRVINRCLIEWGYATRAELKDACERALDIYPLGNRTIDGDINAMRNDSRLGFFAPIRFNRNRGAYYYDDADYSIDKIPLREEEIDAIMFAARLMEQFDDVAIFRRFGDAARKIIETVSAYRMSRDDDSDPAGYIEFERSEWVRGGEYLDRLIEAVRGRVVQRVHYRSFRSGEVAEHTIHPCLLKEYRGRWYLVGYNDRYGEVRTYCLDRIVRIEADNSTKYIDTGFDAPEYYRNVIGVSVLNIPPEYIELEFSEVQAQYVITQPLHNSQERVATGDGSYVFRYYLVPNFEFYAAVLACGNDVKVLKPDSVREQLVSILEKTIKRYAG